jgi:hypothetical protein
LATGTPFFVLLESGFRRVLPIKQRSLVYCLRMSQRCQWQDSGIF